MTGIGMSGQLHLRRSNSTIIVLERLGLALIEKGGGGLERGLKRPLPPRKALLMHPYLYSWLIFCGQNVVINVSSRRLCGQFQGTTRPQDCLFLEALSREPAIRPSWHLAAVQCVQLLLFFKPTYMEGPH